MRSRPCNCIVGILLFLIYHVGKSELIYADPNAYDESDSTERFINSDEFVDIPVGAAKVPGQALKAKLFVQDSGTVDQHSGIYKMKRIRCDWDGDGQLNRPNWAGLMKTSTTGERAAIESSGGDSSNTQLLTEGVIIPMEPQCSPEPSKPWNGFATGGNTGLVRGSILPFSLGGINTRANIVPRKKSFAEPGGGWHMMVEAISKYVTDIYGWDRAPKDYEVYSLNLKGDRAWEDEGEFETPDIMMKLIVDLNPDWSPGFDEDNNLNKDGSPRAYEFRLEPIPKEGNECLLRRIDIEDGGKPEYFGWGGSSWVSLNQDLGDPYDTDFSQSQQTATDEESLATMIAQGMKANGFLKGYNSAQRRNLQGTGKFCGGGGRECKCADVKDSFGSGDKTCKSKLYGKSWCYVKDGVCKDAKKSTKNPDYMYSLAACEKKKKHNPLPMHTDTKNPNEPCQCANKKDAAGHGGGNCLTTLKGVPWCYTKAGACNDGKKSDKLKHLDWSEEACKKSKLNKKLLAKAPKLECKCAGVKDKKAHGGSDCKSVWEEKSWCYIKKGACMDGKPSKVMKAYDYSHSACVPHAQSHDEIKKGCKCSGDTDAKAQGGPDCKSIWEEKAWCFTNKKACKDGKPSKTHPHLEYSNRACELAKVIESEKPPPPPPPPKTKKPTMKPTVKPTPKPTQPKKKKKVHPAEVEPDDDECECDGIEDRDGNGGEECDSKFDNKPWCYVKTDACSDGKHSKTLKSHDWSFKACENSGEANPEADECELHVNGKCPEGCVKGPGGACIDPHHKGKSVELEVQTSSYVSYKFGSIFGFVLSLMFIILIFTVKLWWSKQEPDPSTEYLLA